MMMALLPCKLYPSCQVGVPGHKAGSAGRGNIRSPRCPVLWVQAHGFTLFLLTHAAGFCVQELQWPSTAPAALQPTAPGPAVSTLVSGL